MSCERRAISLADLAAGGEPPAELESHLAGCAACRAALAELRAALAVADDVLGETARVEPSPALRARIRQAVAAEGEAGWRRRRLTTPWAATAAAALVLAVLVAGWSRGWFGGGAATTVATVERHRPAVVGRTTTAEPPVSAERTRSGPSPELPSAARTRVAARAPVRAAQTARRVAEPEVLVPADQAQSLLRFAEAVRRHPLPRGSLVLADLDAPLAEPAQVEIAPIEIAPLGADVAPDDRAGT